MMQKIAGAVRRTGRDKRGFTLIELLSVLVVLAVIAAIAVPRFTGTVKTARENADKASALIIARAAEQKWIDDGSSTEETYSRADLVPNYIREIDWQASASGDVVVVVDSQGRCIYVKYDANGDNLLAE